jgi:hypothetical protein
VSGFDLVWTLRDRLELLAFDARLAGVPQALLEALWEAIDALPSGPPAGALHSPTHCFVTVQVPTFEPPPASNQV